ncbi:hypothetical protein [Halalkalibacter akibai]|uniref:YneQ n=1 Tax=Halalkalibacter akibai (strain ATCC 43226 / DSM 21942 / CIP 109018 / JCM 9157 / 1139) TaxID=1236973 RepID=W4QUH1_HALA3|nr:hypothetical protein [Halalkalibacter akibai]GAE35736.1 hypothetical protein JCM9157_2864 [Halalkalibacter akibai JCM 9157]
MAFGLTRLKLDEWKTKADNGEIAFLTHYWIDERFPECTTVTKVACADLNKLIQWGEQYGLRPEWIHTRDQYPHFDLLGERQIDVLTKEGKLDQLEHLGYDFQR